MREGGSGSGGREGRLRNGGGGSNGAREKRKGGAWEEGR